MRNNFTYLITCLDKKHEKRLFSCGNIELDNYLHTQASQDFKKSVSVTYVLTSHDSNQILGYYSLSSMSVPLDELPKETIKKLPKYPLLPAVLIGRLAVDKKHQGNRIGELLLLDGIKKSVRISQKIGVVAIIVDAKDKEAANFYKHYGFIALPENHHKLFLPINTAKMLPF